MAFGLLMRLYFCEITPKISMDDDNVFVWLPKPKSEAKKMTHKLNASILDAHDFVRISLQLATLFNTYLCK